MSHDPDREIGLVTRFDFANDFTRRQVLRGVLAAGASASAVSLLAACGDDDAATNEGASTAPSGSDAPVANATFAFPGAIDNVDYLRSPAHPATLSNANGGLMRLDREGVLQTNLAEDWSQPDDLTYNYTLRDGLKFSDGSELTTEDVAFSMSTVADPSTASAYNSFYRNVESIRAVTRREIEVKLKRPDSTFAYTPAIAGGWITSKAYAEKHGKKLGTPGVLPVGAGAYRITEFVPAESIAFERNPHYYGDEPRLERLTLRLLTDNSARLLALRSGEIDGTVQVPLEEAQIWRRAPDVDLISVDGGGLAQLYFNLEKAPFDDIHVRKAWLHSYNAAAVAQRLLGGYAEAPTRNGFIPPSFWVNVGLNTKEVNDLYTETLSAIDYNIDAARKELAKSKVPDGFSVTLDYGESQGRVGKALLVLKEALGQIGVTVTVRAVPDAKLFELVSQHNGITVSIVGFGDYPDPIDIYYINYFSEFAEPGNYNAANYRNPAMDKLILDYLATPQADDRKRLDLATQMMKIVQNDVPQIMLWWEKEVAAVGERVTLEEFSAWYLFQPWAAGVRARA